MRHLRGDITAFYCVIECCSCVSSVQTPVDTEDVQPAPNIDHLLSNIGRTALLGEASGERTLLTALSQ